MTDKRLYIAKISFNGWVDNIFLQGENSDEAQKKFDEVLHSLDTKVDTVSDWKQFRAASVEAFRAQGFDQVAK